jgi:predicted transport protein
MPLYCINPNQAISQIKPNSFPKERDLQKLFESNLETLLGVRFIGSEFTTGDRQRGRIDSLGIDQDGYPTIVEYKRSNKENIINQGLFYLDWLVDHKGDFTLAAQKACGADVKIDWSRPRLILIAESFSDYDKYAVNRIGANIELWTYRRYGDDLLYLDTIFVAAPQPTKGTTTLTTKEPKEIGTGEVEPEVPIYSLDDHLTRKSKETQDLFYALRERIFDLAEEGEITEKSNKNYVGYKHGKNFCEVNVQASSMKLWLDIAITELDDPLKLSRDVSNIGHHGTGQVEVRLNSITDLDKVIALVEQSFQQTI